MVMQAILVGLVAAFGCFDYQLGTLYAFRPIVLCPLVGIALGDLLLLLLNGLDEFEVIVCLLGAGLRCFIAAAQEQGEQIEQQDRCRHDNEQDQAGRTGHDLDKGAELSAEAAADADDL